jgi:hypothetical protein
VVQVGFTREHPADSIEPTHDNGSTQPEPDDSQTPIPAVASADTLQTNSEG